MLFKTSRTPSSKSFSVVKSAWLSSLNTSVTMRKCAGANRSMSRNPAGVSVSSDERPSLGSVRRRISFAAAADVAMREGMIFDAGERHQDRNLRRREPVLAHIRV